MKLLTNLDYRQANSGKTSGSRVRFIHDKFEPICLHKPHPKNILKRYQVKQIALTLTIREQA